MQAIAQIKRKIFAIDPRNTATLSRFAAPPVSLNLESGGDHHHRHAHLGIHRMPGALDVER